jgi:hypothetical protein
VPKAVNGRYRCIAPRAVHGQEIVFAAADPVMVVAGMTFHAWGAR